MIHVYNGISRKANDLKRCVYMYTINDRCNDVYIYIHTFKRFELAKTRGGRRYLLIILIHKSCLMYLYVYTPISMCVYIFVVWINNDIYICNIYMIWAIWVIFPVVRSFWLSHSDEPDEKKLAIGSLVSATACQLTQLSPAAEMHAGPQKWWTNQSDSTKAVCSGGRPSHCSNEVAFAESTQLRQQSRPTTINARFIYTAQKSADSCDFNVGNCHRKPATVSKRYLVGRWFDFDCMMITSNTPWNKKTGTPKPPSNEKVIWRTKWVWSKFLQEAW